MMKLHFAPNSRASRIYWLLKELDLPFELNRMDFHPKDLKSDDHRARHPLGRVPVLEDDDVQIVGRMPAQGPMEIVDSDDEASKEIVVYQALPLVFRGRIKRPGETPEEAAQDEAQRCATLLALGDAYARAGERDRARERFAHAGKIAQGRFIARRR